jgi:hypothetical protein
MIVNIRFNSHVHDPDDQGLAFEDFVHAPQQQEQARQETV